MKTVEQLLQAKPHDIWSIAPDCLAYDAIKLMADKNIGALLVVEAENIVGIISERDYLRKLILKGKSPQDIPVREIMTPQVICVRPEKPIEECLAIMTEKGIRHLPVLDDDQLLGVISMRDAVKSIISEKEFIIEQLAEYITTGY